MVAASAACSNPRIRGMAEQRLPFNAEYLNCLRGIEYLREKVGRTNFFARQLTIRIFFKGNHRTPLS